MGPMSRERRRAHEPTLRVGTAGTPYAWAGDAPPAGEPGPARGVRGARRRVPGLGLGLPVGQGGGGAVRAVVVVAGARGRRRHPGPWRSHAGLAGAARRPRLPTAVEPGR